jgi:hypothetical protein
MTMRAPRAVVVYCVRGHEVSREAASVLRGPGSTHATSSTGSRGGPSGGCRRAARARPKRAPG